MTPLKTRILIADDHPIVLKGLRTVLNAQPDYNLIPAETPQPIRSLIRRCLEKNQRRRVQHMGDVRIQIEDALAASTMEPAAASGSIPAAGRSRGILVPAIVIAGVLGVGLAGWFVGQRARPETASAPVRLSMTFAEPPYGQPFGLRRLAISEDGSRMMFETESQMVPYDPDGGYPDVFERYAGSTYLISTGPGYDGSAFGSLVGVTPDLSDVYFTTRDALVPYGRGCDGFSNR